MIFFLNDMLKGGVLLSPGAFFGLDGYLRICKEMPAEALGEGLSRVDAFMARLG